MANLHLVTGYAGREHVTAADQGAFNVAMLGSGQFVIDKGKKLAASIVSNNQIRVQDGDIYMQGRFIRLNEGGYADLVIENGTQGYLRNDLIVARYTKAVETGIEEVNLVVIKGTAVASNPKDPSYSNGNIIEGKAYLNDMPLYRVTINGLTVQSLVPLFTVKKCITAADVGALALDGSNTMTGNLFIEKANPLLTFAHTTGFGGAAQVFDNMLALFSFVDAKKNVNANYRRLDVYNQNADSSLNNAIRLLDHTGGVSTPYNVLHTGNKPSGSYTGNGSATSRTIQTGGIGSIVLLNSESWGSVLVSHWGGLCWNASGVSAIGYNEIRFKNGTITISTNKGAVNANGETYNYQVL